ncbi:tripartite tricarboxylate transporter TctB family protein [Mesorhizobium sp. LHD-90]|uniref:tripartite tricarboxylate transporter TctB family protein n=1 Tax=Mesorhizobium sp. LHD-90 TaxID=3071414 RepID=UPI0027E0221B|nr:tripartite tricarboxylate transporter TctB family protein [Mesorhizobium sp. LHD-90]MDQ6437493.1 tripartite tricarboxylate transporter TctB family protein [Mesorhizobium sp. LHD-90]
MTQIHPHSSDPDLFDDEEAIPAEAEGVAATVILAVVLVLLALAPLATRAQPVGKGWYLAPINWPVFSLGMAALAGAAIVWPFVKAWRGAPDPAAFRANALWAFGGMGFAIEHSIYFCVYLLAVAWVGFTIATVVFMQFIVWRSGLRGRRWVFVSFVVAIAIVLIFRLGIGLWFPLSPLLKLFPSWIGNSLGGVL